MWLGSSYRGVFPHKRSSGAHTWRGGVTIYLYTTSSHGLDFEIFDLANVAVARNLTVSDFLVSLFLLHCLSGSLSACVCVCCRKEKETLSALACVLSTQHTERLHAVFLPQRQWNVIWRRTFLEFASAKFPRISTSSVVIRLAFRSPLFVCFECCVTSSLLFYFLLIIQFCSFKHSFGILQFHSFFSGRQPSLSPIASSLSTRSFNRSSCCCS